MSTLNGETLNPGRGSTHLLIAGQLYSLETLGNICERSWWKACREYRRRHSGLTAEQVYEGVLQERGIPLIPGGETKKL